MCEGWTMCNRALRVKRETRDLCVIDVKGSGGAGR